MAVHYRTQGLVLRKREIGEADYLFSVYTRDFGKLEILARAIRKIKSKLRGNFRLFCLSEIEFVQGKNYKTLTDAILIKEFSEIKKDFKKLKIAYRVSDFLDKLIKEAEEDKALWQLLLEVFEKLNNLQFTAYNLQLIFYYFLWNLFSILGYSPELYHCISCHKRLKPEGLYFSPKEGGVVCSECHQKKKNKSIKIKPATIKILRLILEKNYSTLFRLKIKRENIENLKRISQAFYHYVV